MAASCYAARMSTILQEQPAQYGASGDDELPRREAEALSRMDWEAYDKQSRSDLAEAAKSFQEGELSMPAREFFDGLYLEDHAADSDA